MGSPRACAMLLAASLSVPLAAAQPLPLPGHGALLVPVPEGCKAGVERRLPDGVQASIECPTASALLSIHVLAPPAPAGDDPAELARLAGEAARFTAQKAGVPTPPLRSQDGASARVRWACVQLPKAVDGGGAALANGLLGTPSLQADVTLMAPACDSPEMLGLVAALAGARHDASAADTSGSRARLTWPGRSWSLVLDLPGFELEPAVSSPLGVALHGRHPLTGIEVSAYLEAAHGPSTPAACRDWYWKKVEAAPLPRTGVAFSELPGMAVTEYLIPEVQGVPIRQKNVNAYMARDGIWIDVHLHQSRFSLEDRPVFDALLRGIRFEEN